MKIIEILEEFRKIFANERDKGTAFEKIVKICYTINVVKEDNNGKRKNIN